MLLFRLAVIFVKTYQGVALAALSFFFSASAIKAMHNPFTNRPNSRTTPHAD
jgi:hypothetical protein